MKDEPMEVKTLNSKLPKEHWQAEEEGSTPKGLPIKVRLIAHVPESLEEAAEWFGSEDKLLESIQTDVARRQANAARPVLRDSETILDWQSVGQETIDNYKFGQRGTGRAAVTVDEAELREMTSMDQMLEYLRNKGVRVAVSGGESEDTDEPSNDELEMEGADDELSDEELEAATAPEA